MIWHWNMTGYWCESCGNCIASPTAVEAALPDSCHQCGFPDVDAVTAYHCGDDDDADEMDEDEEFLTFSCGMMPDGSCALAGTEECDWECPRS